MTESKDSLHYRRSLVVEPRVSTQFNQFLPTKDKQTGYVPAPLRKKRAERHEDNRRSWASPMYTEEDGTFTRLFQKRSGYDGSKSMSDIPVDPAVLRQVRYEELQKIRAQARESEDQWQDDLTKWKNRRRSVNSDIVKKKEEREQIESITSGGSTRKSKTFKEMQEERESREQGAPTRYNSSLYSSSQDVFSEPTVTPQPLPRPQPRARTLPPRSHTVDSLYTTTDGAVSPPVPPVQEERSPAQALEPDHITSTLRPRSPSPAKTGTTRASPTIREEPEEIGPNLIELTSVVSNNRTETVLAPDTAPAPAPAPTPTLSEQPSRTCSNITPAFMSKPVDSSAIPKAISKAPEFKSPFSRAVEEQSSSSVYKSNSMDTKPGPARVSASLPRSYQRTESARLPSVVTPRPFGTQSTRISSLPRTFAMDDSHKRLNGETDSQKSSAPSRYSQFMTEEEKRAQVSPALSSNEDEEEEEEEEQKQPLGETPATQSSSDALKPKKETTLVSAPESEDMQELFSDMRICLNQKPNSSQGFGFQTNWDSTGASIRSIQEGSPAELCQLRVGDEVLAVSGHKVSNMTYEQWKGAMDDALQKGCLVMDIRRHGKNSSPEKYINTCSEFNLQSSESTVKAPITSSQPVNDLESKDMNGGFREESVTMRNKGGSESAISDLQVPSISTSSNRWSWDSEDERRRQEKWQKEQERLLQEKYKRDQEKLDEEFRRAQQEATKEALPPSLDDPTQHEEEQCQQSELEERKRRERQEQLQREERERQRRAEEMRQQRMREEEEAERRRLEEEERRRQEAAEEQRQEHERMQQQWAKSKSTPELDEVDKEEGRVVNSGAPDVSWSWDSQRKADQPVSQAEHERQQIIEEMKKKTPLLTDNSWIRQRTSSAGKDPIRRGESLDNLDLRPPSWSAGTPSYSRPQSATSSSTSARPYPRSASSNTLPTSFSTSSMRQSPWAQPPSTSPTPPAAPNVDPFSDHNSSSQRNRSVSGKKICTFCDSPLGRGAAMIIESLGLCYHLGCFKCIDCKSDLGGSESGAEVRIRNRQLYCNSCYVRFKTGQPTTM